MKKQGLLSHILFWLIIMFTYAVSEWGYRDNFWQAIVFELIFLPVRLIAVYTNWFVLLPRLLYKNAILSYFFYLLLLLFALAICQRYITLYWAYPAFFPDWVIQQPIRPLVFFRIVQNLVIIISPVAFSTGIKLFIDWYNQRNKAQQLETEKRAAELKYLKAQINPHFLFNTLNNLYGLSIEQSQKVPGLILKLSDFLSYSLYESDLDKVTVGKELKLIRGFVELEQERYEDRVVISWDIDESLHEKPIASLLFVPLIENAFKHGIREEIKQGEIVIKLYQESDSLVFEVKNTIARTDQENGGIGLSNLKRRLELIYPNAHDLTIYEDQQFFVAKLKIGLHA